MKNIADKSKVYRIAELSLLLMITISVCLGLLTLFQHFGIVRSGADVYSSWWMIMMWFLMSAGCLFSVLLSVKSFLSPSVPLHISLALILTGSLLTHFSAEKGVMHLCKGEQTNVFFDENGNDYYLPFSVSLSSFDIDYYPATDTPKDYISRIVCTKSDGGVKEFGKEYVISMNNVAIIDGYRFFQTSYDQDLNGTVLTVSNDPYGTGLTYFGYICFLLSVVYVFLSPKSKFRRLLKSPLWKSFVLLLMLAGGSQANAFTVSPNVAEEFGKIHILYNGRITTVETYATDFTRKITGKNSWDGLSPNEILISWIFSPDEWRAKQMIKTKKGYISYSEGLKMLYCGRVTTEVDEKLGLIMALQRGDEMKIFPYNDNGKIVWYSPISQVDSLDTSFAQATHSFVPLIYNDTKNGGVNGVKWINAFREKQERVIEGLYSPYRDSMEIFFYRYCRTSVLAYFSLTIGIISFLTLIFSIVRRHKMRYTEPVRWTMLVVLLLISFVIGLRWYISGRVPLSNGYETMLAVSWVSSFLTFVFGRRLSLILPVGFLITGFSLLVSNLGMMNPQITPLMPVLSSPLLSIHVSAMMFSYTLFGFITLVSILSFILTFKEEYEETVKSYTLLVKFLLYPSVFLLAIGIFIGAVWANVSWGEYWSWDPKETWALVTMLLYSVSMHSVVSERFSPRVFHLYIVLCACAILMTYFGVNYLLGGMHSYASEG